MKINSRTKIAFCVGIGSGLIGSTFGFSVGFGIIFLFLGLWYMLETIVSKWKL